MSDRHVHILAMAARQTQRASWPPGARRAAIRARVDENRWIDEGGSLGWTR